MTVGILLMLFVSITGIYVKTVQLIYSVRVTSWLQI